MFHLGRMTKASKTRVVSKRRRHKRDPYAAQREATMARLKRDLPHDESIKRELREFDDAVSARRRNGSH